MAVAATIILLPTAGCGPSGPAQPAASTSRTAKTSLVRCLRQHRVPVATTGHVAFRTVDRRPRIQVPARYVGAAVMGGRSVADLWLAADHATAVRSQRMLNRAAAVALGQGPGGEYSQLAGRVISALSYSPNVSLARAQALDGCASRT